MSIVKTITNYDFEYIDGWVQYSHESPNFITYCKLSRWRHGLISVNRKHKLLGVIVPPKIHTLDTFCVVS